MKHAIYQNGGFVSNVITTLLQRLRIVSVYSEEIVNC